MIKMKDVLWILIMGAVWFDSNKQAVVAKYSTKLEENKKRKHDEENFVKRVFTCFDNDGKDFAKYSFNIRQQIH